MTNGGKLTVSTKLLQDSNEVLLTVSDTGTGIEPDILQNIFEAFVTNKQRGTGLGLTISYDIVMKHHGRITAENNPDAGALFQSLASSQKYGDRMSNSGHILIIDDEATLRQTMARILQQAGFEVTTAENGEQGLSFIKTTNFDLIFMDLRMPGMAGMDVLKLIHAGYPNLPVILFTAQPDLNSAVEALRNGATDYLLKPLKPQAVIERAQSILANQQKENRKREITLQIEALQAELKSLTSGQTGPLQAASVGSDRFLKRGRACVGFACAPANHQRAND